MSVLLSLFAIFRSFLRSRAAVELENLALRHQLPDGERPPEHTHVEMYAANQYILDPALLHEIVGFGGIGDGVAIGDLDRGILARPGIRVAFLPRP